ncbi:MULTISPECIES: DNA polymerase I [Pseudonocardia]|uniref:DNA polymerase I n=2 Tax=Pseudonocardia TaxID=1847 RepID=A0A1Y2N2P2_PSEAH|nr:MULTISPECIES: DNA polymerase I [Pseudonocardia]OSY41745.1 DNA polymerase I [Pseudonocardia autotrophica]TDN71203.1 DNA polymerase I [Pseudonocardia autotrophica]BBG01874.1 DNA polymerase [Pseudonocardia autotrophica]GEC23039.1 DNA polymerase [Pseudonocardia saturnea]
MSTATQGTQKSAAQKSGTPKSASAKKKAPDRPRLLLLDGHSLAYRAFFALPAENFRTGTGQTTNAVYGFTSMLINLLRDEEPTHLAVAFDVSRKTFRSERYADYKANRSATPDDFRGQIDLIKEVLGALSIPVFAVDGYEADDLIATLATQAEQQGFEVLITTGDRDAFQLVSDDVTVLYPKRGVSDLGRIDPAEVDKRYGLTPTQYPDFAALRGDPSDNLPSIPGVGEKTAAKWVREFGSLAELTDRVDEVKGKAGDSLRTNLANVLLNRQLTELVRDVDLGSAPEQLEVRAWDRDAVHRLFDELEFRVLRERLFATLSSAEPEAEDGFEISGEVIAPGGARAWLDSHARDGRRVGLSFAGVAGPVAGRDLTGVALAVGEPTVEQRAAGATAGVPKAGYLGLTGLTPDDEAALGDWLADAGVAKAAHDIKPVLHALRARGWSVAGLSSDTALAAYLARPGQRTFDLADLALRYLRRELRTEEPADGQLSLLGGEEEADAQAAQQEMLSASAVAELADALDTELAQRGGTELLADLELPLAFVLAGCEAAGIAVDSETLSDLESDFGGQVREAAASAYEVIGKEINLGSPKQLQVVLFDELNMPKTKRTKTGYTTDADALQTLYEQTEHPFLQFLLQHRDATRLKVTVDGLIKTFADDGRIHTTYSQTIAATGRLSSTDPNLQNVPIRTAAGRRIRDAFVVGAGPDGERYAELMTADYSQIEMRIMAHLSEDAALIEAFRSQHDFHAETAARVFGVEATAVSVEQRAKIKAMNYGLAYGLSAYGLSGQLRISTDEAKGLMDDYFAGFGGVRDYLAGVVDQARKDGYTATILGRRRYLPDLTSDNRQRREMAERMALNAPIQGSAADIIKVAMLGVFRGLAEEGLRSRMLLQVHDELVLEVADGEREVLEKLVRERMGAAAQLSVPLEVSVGYGRSWDAAAH